MADMLNTASIVSFMLTGVFLIIAITLFFVFKIPFVLNYLSGMNKKHSVGKLRKNNKTIGKNSYGTNNINKTGNNNKKEKKSDDDSLDEKTGILNDNYSSAYEQEKTGILREGTEVLSDNDATIQLKGEQYKKQQRTSNIVFEYIDDIMLIHTEEVIL